MADHVYSGAPPSLASISPLNFYVSKSVALGGEVPFGGRGQTRMIMAGPSRNAIRTTSCSHTTHTMRDASSI